MTCSISNKPNLDTEIADILLGTGGGDINHRNRYGCMPAHDTVMAKDYTPAGKKKNVVDALKYFMDKAGDVDVKDGDELQRDALGRD